MNKILFLLFIFTSPVAAQKQVTCDIEAGISNKDYSSASTDRAGTNIRKGPGTKFAVVKTLRDETGFLFHVTANQGRWLKIDEYLAWGENGGRSPLDGWIYAPSVFVLIAESGGDGKFVGNLYAAPDWKSSLLFPKNKPIRDVVPLQGCQGKWAKVAYKGKIGWLNPYSQCASLWDEGPCSESSDN